jgi:hypothetical protein
LLVAAAVEIMLLAGRNAARKSRNNTIKETADKLKSQEHASFQISDNRNTPEQGKTQCHT